MKTLTTILVEAHRKFLDGRSIHRLVSMDSFELAYNNADEESKILVLKLIDLQDLKRIKVWVLRELRDSLEHFTHAQLVDLARQEGILYYSKLSKAQLLSELKNKGAL